MNDSLLANDELDSLAHYQRLWVGFSGGLDSTVLLHHLATQPSLAGKVKAVHIHHGLSPYADDWLLHCQQFCKERNISLVVHQVEFESQANIEERARKARYQVFASLVEEHEALVLGHHADDQAETLLLQLCRGSGVDGLSAMPAQKAWANGVLLRPLLRCSRQQLQIYAEQHQLIWVEDESNQNPAFSRNYLRHHIMPLLRDKWPGVVTSLGRSASHCQQAKNNLEALAEIDCLASAGYEDTLSLVTLRALDYDRLVNALRGWLKHHQVRCPSTILLNRLIDEVIGSHQEAEPMIAWDHHEIRRYQQKLYLLQRAERLTIKPPAHEWSEFPAPVPFVGKAGYSLTATLDDQGLVVPVGCCVSVRYRQGGELIRWHGQTKQLKKLWQQWLVPPWLREQVPLIYLNDELAAVVGYAISDSHFGQKGADIYRVELVETAYG